MDFITVIGEISSSFHEYYGSERMLVIALFCMMLAYLYFPGIKKIILYPTMLILFLIVNPILYEKIFSSIIYWRMLWMIPCTYLIAYVICQLVKVGSSLNKKIMILCCMCLFIAASGYYVYTSENFQRTQNLEKVDSGVKEVGDFILENCDSPKCLMREKYLSEIRQYSIHIELLYGRNVFDYITATSDELKKIAEEMESKKPDYSYVLEKFKENNCNVIVVWSRAPIEEHLMYEYRLEELGRLDESIIYKTKDNR